MRLLDYFKPKPATESTELVDNLKARLVHTEENLFQIQQQLDHRLMEERNGNLLLRPYTQRALPPITVNELFEAVGISRWCATHIPEAKSVLTGLKAYCIGSTPNISVLDENEQIVNFIDSLVEKNDLLTLITDSFLTEARDGECFIELVPDGEVPKLKLIDSACVRAPSDTGNDDRQLWDFGILTAEDAGEFVPEVKGYCIYNKVGTKYRKLSTQFVFHSKYNNNGHKRSMPIFTACLGELLKLPELRRAGMFGEIARQSVAFFRIHEYGDKASIDAIRNFRDGIAGDVSRPIPAQLIHPGEVIDIPTSLTVEQPPTSPNAASMETQAKLAIQAIAAATGLPTWLVGGDPAPGSFASSLTSESPFLRNIEHNQFRICKFWKKIINACVQYAQANGLIDAGIKPEVELTLAEALVHNLVAQVQAMEILYKNRAISRKTFTASAGFDPKEEEQNIKSEELLPSLDSVGNGDDETRTRDANQERPE